MKVITLYILLFFIAFGATAQQSSHVGKNLDRGQENLRQHIDDKVFAANKWLFSSSPLQHIVVPSHKNNSYTMSLDSIISVSIHPETEQWVNDWKDEFRYDDAWKTTELLYHDWVEEAGEWMVYDKTELTYNSEGRVVYSMDYYYDNDYGDIEDVSKTEYYYDSSGKLDSLHIYEGENVDDLTMITNMYLYYNQAGKIAELAIIGYDDEEEEWLPATSMKYTYNAAGNLALLSHYFPGEEEPFLYSSTEYFYDNNGRLEATESSAINFSSFTFEKTYRTVYAYNDAGDQSEVIDYEWFDGSWAEQDKEVYIYDADIDFSDVAFPYHPYYMVFAEQEASVELQKLLVATEGYQYIDGGFVMTDQSTYHYSPTSSTGIATASMGSAGLYPNPATAQITLTWTSDHEVLHLEVYQINGARVMQQQVTANTPIVTDHLTGGLYLYRLTDNGQVVYSGKFVRGQ